MRASQAYPLRFARAAARLRTVSNVSVLRQNLILFSENKVRDSWAEQVWRSQKKPTAKINYQQDTWDDANLEQVLVWLEEHLRARRRSPQRCFLDEMQ